VSLGNGQILALHTAAVEAGTATVGVRPEHLTLDAPDGAAFAGTVTHVEYLGDEVLAHVDLALGVTVALKRPADVDIRVGAEVRVGILAERCHLFDANGVRVG
jgi:multiple sugar transport system ATP-binding protein